MAGATSLLLPRVPRRVFWLRGRLTRLPSRPRRRRRLVRRLKRLHFHTSHSHKNRTSPCQQFFGSGSTLDVFFGGGGGLVEGAHPIQRAVPARMPLRHRLQDLQAVGRLAGLWLRGRRSQAPYLKTECPERSWSSPRIPCRSWSR